MQLSSIIIDDEPHARIEIYDLITITPNIICQGSFENIGDALEYLKQNDPVDIVFCDVSMPDVDGLEAGMILKAYCDYLIYVTAHRFHGPETYEVKASGYLLKPLRFNKFTRQIQDIMDDKEESLWRESEDQTIFVKGSDKNSFLPINAQEIVYIQGMDNYIKFFTTEGEKTTYMQLKDLESTLMRQQRYLRVAKSIIISLKFLEKVDGYVAYMKTGEVFNIGKVYRPAFRNLLQQRRLN
ncbi:two-component system LytT family response regulator [Flavobacterium sp. W4I14]|nr:two-component system LytT family response regulator [Flavobacterium sp. W4I14]